MLKIINQDSVHHRIVTRMVTGRVILQGLLFEDP